MLRKQMPTLPRILPRPRLENLLNRAIHHRFSLVTGSPGQGKTSLVTSVLKSLPYNVFWYSLDTTNTNSSKFIFEFFEFLDLASKPGADVNSFCYDSPEDTCSAFTDFLLKIPLENDIFIVLDDFHIVEESSDFDIFVQSLIAIAPPCFHFIIISRDEPQWKLAQKKVKREMLRIHNNQLTFTPGEIRGFFKDIYNINLSADQISRAMFLIEGWTPVMVLLGEMLTIEPEILNTDAENLLRKIPELRLYLEEEIYNALPSAQKNILLEIAIVKEIPADLANDLVGNEGAIVLSDLVAKNVLMDYTKGKHSAYRLHTLWRSFLLQKAAETLEKDKIGELNRQAGTYFFARGQWKKAFYHFIEGQDLQMAIEVLKNSGPEILNYNLSNRLHLLVNSIPIGKMKDDPWLQFAFACSVRFRDPALCHDYLHQALEGFRKINDSKGQLQVLFLNTEVLILFPGDLHQMQNLLAYDSTYTDSKELSDLRISAYKNVYAAMSHCWLTGHLSEAIRLGEEARKTSFTLKDINLKLWSSWALALASSFIGNFDVAQKRLTEALEIVDSPEVDDIVSVFIPYIAGVNADFMGEFDVAHTFLKDAHNKAKKSKMEGLDFFIKNYASYSALYRGDIQLSEKLLNDMGDIIGMCLRVGNDHLSSYFWCWRGHYMFIKGQHYEAVALGRQALRLRERAGGEIYFVECNLLLGAALIEVANFEEAEYHLQEALRRSIAMGSLFFQASCYIQLAILHEILGNKQAFAKYIKNAYRLAMEKSFFHFFMWRNDRMARIISLTEDNDEYKGYVRELRRRRLGTIEPTGYDNEEIKEKISLKPLKLSVLGPMIIDIQGFVHENIGLKKPLYLLAMLAVKSAPISTYAIIEEMWPERDMRLAKDNFHFTLNRLRKFLGDNDLINLRDGFCSINLEKCSTDIQYFNLLNERAAKLAESNRKSEAIDLLKESTKIFRGDLLEGEFLGPLLTIEREALAKKSYDSLISYGKLLLEMGRYEEAVNILTEASSKCFADEYSYRLLMLAHYVFGNKGQALQTYKKLAQYLASELDTSPHTKTIQLRDFISDGVDWLVSDLTNWLSEGE